MRIKQAIEALEVAQDALDISQSLQESAKSNHHPKTLAAYERVSAALAALRSMPTTLGKGITRDDTVHGEEYFTRAEVESVLRSMPQGEPVRCPYCDDTGDVHSIDGEWRGTCKCPAGATPHTEAVRMSEAELVAWKLVPIEPTSNMLAAMSGEWHSSRHGAARKQYAAMLSTCVTSPPAPVLSDAWQPIETAPKDGTEILLSNGETVAQGNWLHAEPYIREKRDLEGRYIDQDESEGYDGWIDSGGGMQPDPTHWIPLPPPPVEQATAARLGVKMGDVRHADQA